MRILKQNSGQMLIEVLVALGIIVTALVFSVSAATTAQKVARTARSRLEAGKYAEAVLENLRNQRNLDQEAFFAVATCGSCGPFGTNNMYSCQLDCVFTPDRLDVTVTMSWLEGNSTSTMKLSTVMTKYDL